MKKLPVIIVGIVIIYAGYIGISLMFLPAVTDLQDRRTSMTIQVRDWHGSYHPFVVGPKNRYWTTAGNIPLEMKWAVILAEGGILRAETLRFVDEVRSPESIGLPAPAKPSPAAVKRMRKAIDGLAAARLDPRELVDESAKLLRALKIADVDKYNYCRASHAEANAIAQAARYGVAIKDAALYVTLQPCFVCLKLLATAQIRRVYFELAYESRDAARDAFWEAAVKEAGIEVFQQLTISPGAMDYIIPSLTGITSRRRLAATTGAAEPYRAGALEQD